MKDLIKAVKDAVKANEQLTEESSRQSQTFNNHFRQTLSMMDDYAKQMTDSSKIVMGATRSYAEMEKINKRIGEKQKKHYEAIEKLEQRITNIRNNGIDEGMRLNQDQAEQRIEQLNYEMALQMKNAKKIHDYEANLIQERATERENRFKEYQELTKNHKKNMERMGSFGKDIAGKAKSGDISGIASGGLEGLGSVLKQLGGVGKTMGAVATALGVTVGLLGVFVALMFEADKKAKDMNKNFMQGASGLDLMGKNFQKGQLTKRLFDMREMAFDVGMQFRMSAEDVATLASSFNQFGLRYDEMARMSGEGDPVKALEENLSVAITKSKMLGVEANTVAEQIASMNENFAMDLSQIDEAFTAIYTSAQTTGIATQKFFAMITQVTGGMSLLNVDFAQTAAIAGELVESLGEAAGSKFLSDLANRGASKSYQERMKSAMLSGGKTSRISKKGVRARAKQLESSSAFKSLAGSSEFQNALESLGVTGFNANDIMGSFDKMTAQQQRNLIASSGNTALGGSAEIERQLRALQQLNISSKQGGVTGAAVQMGQFNTGENMAQFLAEAGAFADLSKGQSLGGLSRAVLEQISGKSGMEVDQLVTMVDKMNSNMGVVQTYSERMGKMMEEGQTGEAALAKLAQEQNMSSMEFQKMLQEQYKLTIGADGKVKSSITGSEITNLEDYMINMGDSMKDGVKEAMTKEQMMTQEIIKNTASASSVLENMIGKQLNKISGFVEGIYDFLTFDKRDIKGEEKRARTRNLDDMIEAEYQRKQSLESEVESMEKTGGGSKREKALLAAKKEELRITTATLKAREAERTALLTSGSEDQMRERMATINAELLAETGSGTLTEEQKKREDALRRKAEEDYVRQTTRGLVSSVLEGDLEHDYGFGQDEGFDLRFLKNTPAVKAMYETNALGLSEERIDEILAGYAKIQMNDPNRDKRTEAFKIGEEGYSGLFESSSTMGVESHGYNKGMVRGDFQQRLLLENTKRSRIEAQTGIMSGDASATEVLEALSDDQYDQLQQAQEAVKTAKASDDSLSKMAENLKTNAADTDEMKKFQKKNLAPAIGQEVMKAMVAEKLFEVAAGAGMTIDQVMEAYASQTDSDKTNNKYVGDDLKRRLDAKEISPDEYNKQMGVLKVLGMQDGLSLPDGTLQQMGKGQLIIRPDGQAILTGEDDGVAVGTKIGKGGSTGGGSGAVIMNVDKVVTTARNGAELADALMKEMKRNPNTKKRIRRSRN